MAEVVKLSAAELAEKWGRRLKGATTDIRRGVEALRDSPMEKAAEQQEKMISRLNEAIRTGKWARGLRRVSLQMWKDKVLNVGLGRIAAGVDASQEKMRDFASELIDHENAGLVAINRMPDTTLEDSVARAVAWMRHMAEFTRG